jgi:hypothetical protein
MFQPLAPHPAWPLLTPSHGRCHPQALRCLEPARRVTQRGPRGRGGCGAGRLARAAALVHAILVRVVVPGAQAAVVLRHASSAPVTRRLFPQARAPLRRFPHMLPPAAGGGAGGRVRAAGRVRGGAAAAAAAGVVVQLHLFGGVGAGLSVQVGCAGGLGDGVQVLLNGQRFAAVFACRPVGGSTGGGLEVVRRGV